MRIFSDTDVVSAVRHFTYADRLVAPNGGEVYGPAAGP